MCSFSPRCSDGKHDCVRRCSSMKYCRSNRCIGTSPQHGVQFTISTTRAAHDDFHEGHALVERATFGLLRRCDIWQEEANRNTAKTRLCGRAFMIASISFAAVKLGPCFSIARGASASGEHAIIDTPFAALAAGRTGSTFFVAHELVNFRDCMVRDSCETSIRRSYT